MRPRLGSFHPEIQWGYIKDQICKLKSIFNNSNSTDQSDRIEGIVYKTNEKEIVVAYKELHDFEGLKQPLSLVMLANEVTHKRCKEAI